MPSILWSYKGPKVNTTLDADLYTVTPPFSATPYRLIDHTFCKKSFSLKLSKQPNSPYKFDTLNAMAL